MPHFAMSCRQNAAVGPSRQRRSRPFHEREALSLVQWSRADGVSPRNGTANQTRRRSHRACCARAARHLLRRIRADCPGRRSRVLLRNLDPPGARHQLLPLPWRRACRCGGLRVDSRAALLQGGDSGPAIVPGNPQASLLVQAISRHPDVSAMPPESENALRPDQVTEFESWISADAVWPAEGPAFEVAGHWAFAPVVAVSPPPVNDAGWCRTTIDRFIRGRQEAAGSEPLPTADRRTLIRRATFDLTGLPPTPEEVEAFLSDPSPRCVCDGRRSAPRLSRLWRAVGATLA